MSHEEAASLVVERLTELVRAASPPRQAWPTRVVSSPWERTTGPAVRIATELDLPFDIDERLSELSFGNWEGATYASLEAEDGERFNRWMTGYLNERPPGGETLDELRARVTSFLYELQDPEDVPILITHAGVIRALRALASGRSYASEMMQRVEHLRPEPLWIDEGARPAGDMRG